MERATLIIWHQNIKGGVKMRQLRVLPKKRFGGSAKLASFAKENVIPFAPNDLA